MRRSLSALALAAAACGQDPAVYQDGGPIDAVGHDGTSDDAAVDAPADAAVDAGIDADLTPQTFFGNNATDQNAGGMFPESGSAALAAHDALVARLVRSASEGFTAAPLGALPATGDTASMAVLSGWAGGGNQLTQDLTGLVITSPAAISDNTVAGRFNTTPGSGGVVGPGRWIEASSPFTLTLAMPSHAIGLYVTDAGDFGSTLRIELFLGGAAVGSLDVPPIEAVDGNLAFYGRVDPSHPFDRVVVTIVQTGTAQDSWDRIGFDDLVVGRVD